MGKKVDFESDNYVKNTVKRILSKITIDSNGCWLWIGCTNEKYGIIRYKEKNYGAHRLSFEIFNNQKIGNKFVCHTCDKPLCINPEHLFLGSHEDNMKDAVSKRRMSFGEKHYNHKIKQSEVEEIRKLLKCGFSQSDISQIFNVCQSSISAISSDKNWNHQLKTEYDSEKLLRCIRIIFGDLQMYKLLTFYEKIADKI